MAAVSSPERSRSMIEICFARADRRSRENEKEKEKEGDRLAESRGRWKRNVKGSLGVSRQIESKTRCFIKAAGSMVVHQPR